MAPARSVNLLLDPHGDDAVLFSCFNLLRHRPHVIVVLRSQVQEDRGTGITARMREAEQAEAFRLLDVTWSQWGFLDRDPDWDEIERTLRGADNIRLPELVLAPAREEGGHEQHNAIADLAVKVFGKRVVPYLTYVRGHGRSEGFAVDPGPEWIALKHRALACFASQIREPSTRPWFLDRLDEYVA